MITTVLGSDRVSGFFQSFSPFVSQAENRFAVVKESSPDKAFLCQLTKKRPGTEPGLLAGASAVALVGDGSEEIFMAGAVEVKRGEKVRRDVRMAAQDVKRLRLFGCQHGLLHF